MKLMEKLKKKNQCVHIFFYVSPRKNIFYIVCKMTCLISPIILQLLENIILNQNIRSMYSFINKSCGVA